MQLLDVLLLSVIVITGYVGPMVLRRFGPGQRLYGWMLVGDLIVALLAFTGRYVDGPSAAVNLAGVISVGAGVCLVVMPPILRDLGRRAMSGNRLRLAATLADLRELLQPGMGARQERELIGTILAVREGREDTVVDALMERRAAMDSALGRRMVDERVIMTYLYARRWSDAIAHFESSFGQRHGSVSPQLLVEMIRAYCEVGDLEGAAEIMPELEASPVAGEPLVAVLMQRARLVFLAFVGRTSAVESMVAPTGSLGGIAPSARLFWSGIARLRAGDRSGARDALREAARLSGGDPHAQRLAQARLQSVDEPGVAGPHSIPPSVAELADRLTEAATEVRRSSVGSPAAPRLTGLRWKEVPVTTALLAVNLMVAVAIYFNYGTVGDLGALIESGANLKSATRAGEWWRLASSTFVHVGLVHLAINMYGLWVLGRLVEQFFGRVRFFAIYAAAGIGGALTSVYFGGPTTSAGASGAIFGLLGALVVELGLHRAAYPKRWSGALFGNLLFLALANIVIGFLYPVIDQSAHVGGIVVGALVGAALSLKGRMAKSPLTRGGAALAAALGALVMAAGLIGASVTSYADTLERYPKVDRVVGGLVVTVPSSWVPASRVHLTDPGAVLLFDIERISDPIGVEEAVAVRLEYELKNGVADAGFDEARRVQKPTLAISKPWHSAELEVAVGGMGGQQHFRVAVFARKVDREVWRGALYYPAAFSDGIEPLLSEILGSLRPSAYGHSP